MRRAGICVLVLSVFAFAGVASAGNGSGKGNQGDTPGNSASAPGQVKKDDPPPAAQTTTATTTAATPATTTDANTTGVKPSNDTAHDTHAAAQSDETKQYGNGQTAGQVAEKNGADGKAVLHGPGNSQPHKTAPCSGGHEVDVHALRNRHGTCDSSEPTSTPMPHPHPDSGLPVTPTTTAATTTTTTTTTTTHRPPKDPGLKPAGGESSASTGMQEGRSDGVLVSAEHAATLPFTGARLWIVVLAGLILIATGLALREIRTAEAVVQSGHDHTDRSRHPARGSDPPVGGRSGR